MPRFGRPCGNHRISEASKEGLLYSLGLTSELRRHYLSHGPEAIPTCVISSVHRRFGSSSLRTHPHLSAQDFVLIPLKGIRTWRLDMATYEGIREVCLDRAIGMGGLWTKHGESVYTISLVHPPEEVRN